VLYHNKNLHIQQDLYAHYVDTLNTFVMGVVAKPGIATGSRSNR